MREATMKNHHWTPFITPWQGGKSGEREKRGPQDYRKFLFLWYLCFHKLPCNHQPLGSSACGVQERLVRWHRVQWKCPRGKKNDCCIHSKIEHSSEVATSKADHCTSSSTDCSSAQSCEHSKWVWSRWILSSVNLLKSKHKTPEAIFTINFRENQNLFLWYASV